MKVRATISRVYSGYTSVKHQPLWGLLAGWRCGVDNACCTPTTPTNRLLALGLCPVEHQPPTLLMRTHHERCGRQILWSQCPLVIEFDELID